MRQRRARSAAAPTRSTAHSDPSRLNASNRPLAPLGRFAKNRWTSRFHHRLVTDVEGTQRQEHRGQRNPNPILGQPPKRAFVGRTEPMASHPRKPRAHAPIRHPQQTF